MPGNVLGRTARPADRPLIAVVDDDASFLRSVGRLLRAAGYDVQMFGTARDFLAHLPACKPQCLVLDVHMPGMSGLELQERLAADGSCLPIIFVTAYDTPQTRESARRAGGFGLLLKPFDQQALLQTIAFALSGQPPDTAPSQDPRQDRPNT